MNIKNAKEQENLLVLNRRKFIQSASAAALITALHPSFLFGRKFENSSKTKNGSPLIGSLRLLTAAPLNEMKEYYHAVLDLPVLDESSNQITIVCGQTRITFVKAEPGHGEPWYHVAFNIPENKLWLARKWQLERGPLKERPPGPNVDAKYPGVIHYPRWNAHSVFFWDPAGNLLEYIARHDLKNDAPGPFTSEDILYASEIGIMTDDVAATASEMREALGIENYRNHNDHFHPIGDEYGLLIMFKLGRPWRRNNIGDTLPTKAYPTVARIRGERQLKYTHSDYPYEISAS